MLSEQSLSATHFRARFRIYLSCLEIFIYSNLAVGPFNHVSLPRQAFHSNSTCLDLVFGPSNHLLLPNGEFL